MRIIDRDKIIILDNRQRREFDPVHIIELAESIQKNLLHPVVVRKQNAEDSVPPGTPSDAVVLVAGETRLKAMEHIWFTGKTFFCNGAEFSEGFVPCNNLGDLSPIEAEEAELDENIRRRDLSWQERADATNRLFRLRGRQAEATATPAPTIAAIAEELRGRSDGSNQDAVRKDIIVAQHLDNPLIAKAKSTDEAYKILKAEEVRVRNENLAAVVGATLSSASHTTVNTDCVSWMKEQPSEQFDVLLTDPPYGMGANSFGDSGGKLANITHAYDDSPEHWQKLMRAWAPEAFRLMKPQAHAYVFCDIERFADLKAIMAEAGWDVFRTPFIVHKLNSGRVPRPEHGPRRQWEMLLYAIKGGKQVTHIYPDVITCQGDPNVTHGAQKPVSLYQNLLQRSVRPGDRVLDTFAGTGTIFPAAHAVRCLATGIELEASHYGTGIQRLRELDSQSTIPGL